MVTIDVGDKASNQIDVVPLSVQPGATVTVKNVAGDTLNYFASLNGSATGTIANAASQAFTVGAWLTAGTNGTGRTSIQITGTGY